MNENQARANARQDTLDHHCGVAKPPFEDYVSKIDVSIARWLQYQGYEIEGSRLYFRFKSSQCSLNFKVYAGVALPTTSMVLDGSRNALYEFFRSTKYAKLAELKRI